MKTTLKLAQADLETFKDGFLLVSKDVVLPEDDASEVITRVITFLLAFTAIIAVAAFIWGAFKYLTSLGDETKVSSAKKVMLYSVLGLVLVLGSYAVLQFIRSLVGV